MKAPSKKNAPAPPAPTPTPEPRPASAYTLTYKETMALCGISRMTLWRWRTHEGLPFLRGRIAPAELARWLIERAGLGKSGMT